MNQWPSGPLEGFMARKHLNQDVRVTGVRCVALALALAAAATGRASVSDVSPAGFTIRVTAHVEAAPDKVYSLLIVPARWWDREHTFSGDAASLHLEARAGGCFCESLPGGGSVQHLTVVYVAPGKVLRLRGALGPLQGAAVDGVMTWSLKPSGENTELSLTYAVGGYSKDGFDEVSKAADGVLTAQVARLKAVAEGRSPDAH
jgi:uncharacterized protein YndB with AHSA1/START domain